MEIMFVYIYGDMQIYTHGLPSNRFFTFQEIRKWSFKMQFVQRVVEKAELSNTVTACSIKAAFEM